MLVLFRTGLYLYAYSVGLRRITPDPVYHIEQRSEHANSVSVGL